MRTINTHPSDLLRHFSYIFPCKLGNGRSEKFQTVLDINSMCNLCMRQILSLKFQFEGHFEVSKRPTETQYLDFLPLLSPATVKLSD